ncbi:M28 family peptidase [Sphingobium sp. AP49]|uniref:M28 family peptidase n=1 Tax=Sphingobium sp. AP49 TaxID=1144307 RepID=UPI0009DA1EDC|nr:M28 family peptidase [Sphingobium sp. AP49]WHO38138.1 M28 family peptidase [Sphingobium sp. AP49]
MKIPNVSSETVIRLTAIGLLLLLFGLPTGVFIWMTAVPGQSYLGPLPPLTLDQSRLTESLKADVAAIASRPHNLQYPRALEAAARHLEQELEAADYDVQRQYYEASGRPVRNIEVVLQPMSETARTLVIGAHYDSAGDAPGANDNGSGAAALLALARRMTDLRGRTPIKIRLVFFVNEEPPFFQTSKMGSAVYAKQLRQSGEDVLGMISLETMGYYSDQPGSQHYPFPLGLRYPGTGNFVAFVGMLPSRSFVRQTVEAFRKEARFPSIGGVAPGALQGIGWSDHWSFANEGIPALMVTDTAPFRYPYYHTTRDAPDKINYQRLARVVSGLESLIRRWPSSPSQ